MEGGQEPESEPEQGDPAWVHRLQVVKKFILAYACKESPTKREPRTLTWPLGCQEGNSDGQATHPSQSQEESVDEAPTPSVLPPGQLCPGLKDLGPCILVTSAVPQGRGQLEEAPFPPTAG